jgi:DMSO/TMAO reductase YedYZ molybdopterin-dependent catalytic subunit
MINRREIMKRAGGGVALLGAGTLGGRLTGPDKAHAAGEPVPLDPALPQGLRDGAGLDALPGKRPLIKLSYRPPNYETPTSYFNSLYTPNDAFFVRYHLANIPELDAAAWRLKIGGDGATKPFELTLEQLKTEFQAVEIAAVCQCSGNRRGLFTPHVPGVQWGYGAVGNAKWKGARLKDILERAGIAKSTVEIVFDGADGPVLDKTPDFVKSLPVWKALEENALVAYEMNGQPLPHLNGFPARVVIPGWTATYWVKHITSIEARTAPYEGFWMKSAYRVPNGKFPTVQRFLSQETAANTPITEIVVNSMITNLVEGQGVALGTPTVARGVAWDAGYVISSVDVSSDGGKTWAAATLGEDAGRFSFRPWSFAFSPTKAGSHTLMARAANKIGQSQTTELILNPAGYNHNLMHRVTINVA